MTAELPDRPAATTYDVETLVHLAWRGDVRVPHFQRSFRWQRRDVIRLFDSIVRGYPVGSLLLWRRPAPAQRLRFGALEIDAPARDEALWVVDGQQRITSLANALHPDGVQDERFKLAYDLDAEQFVPLPPGEEPTVLPLPVIFDLKSVLRWFARHPEIVDSVEQANRVTKTLRQFAIPAYEVAHAKVEVLQDIFDRMNNYGKRLSRAEVFSALFAGEESAQDTRLTLDRIAEEIDQDLGFGAIDKDTVLKAVLARRGPDVLREIRNEFPDDGRRHPPHGARAVIEFPEEDRDTAYRRGGEALRRAVGFLQDVAGVPHVSMLPYRHLLVALTRLFAHHPEPDTRSIRLLRRWFWRAAVTGPEIFKGSTIGAIRYYCFAVKRDDLAGSLEELLRLADRHDRPRPDLRRFRSNEAGTKMLLCSWWAQRPRSLRNGRPFERAALAEQLTDRATALDAVRDVVPRQRVPEQYRTWAANRVLLPTDDVDSSAVEGALLMRPKDIRPEDWRATLESHLLDDQLVAALAAGNVVGFLEERQRRIQQRFDYFLRGMCEWDFEDTPSLDTLLVEDLDLDEAS